MSFNYLEVARAAELISEALPDEVQVVELVRFPLERGSGAAASIPDVNVGLKLKRSKKMIVFSLKQPWTGLFFMPASSFAPAGPRGTRPAWSTAFNGCEGPAQDWNAYIQNQTLQAIATVPGDRIVTLVFANGAGLRVELFPARPNWILTAGGQEFRWRSSLPARPPGLGNPALNLREFTAEGAKPAEDRQQWMARVYDHYLTLRQAQLLQTQRQRALTQLQGRLTRLIKIRGQMEDSLEESAKAEQVRVNAETLKGRLHEFTRGQKTKRVDDIDLDPKHTIADNVTLMFSRYKKLQRTRREVEARLVGIEEENRKITGAIARVRGFTGMYTDFLKLLGAEGITLEEGLPGAKPEKKEDRRWRKSSESLGLRQFQSKDGLHIWVGRNHRENEELVIRLARGNDLWMHLKGRPGAHVIVQMPGGKSPSLETLLDGATLVAYYSGVSDKEKVEVDYTFRKFVKRVPGGGEKFLVTYTQNKTLMLKMEDSRLWRLLKQH